MSGIFHPFVHAPVARGRKEACVVADPAGQMCDRCPPWVSEATATLSLEFVLNMAAGLCAAGT